MSNYLPRAKELFPQLVEDRRQIHRHPELAFEETATADLVARKLREWGFEVATGVGTTGGFTPLSEPVV